MRRTLFDDDEESCPEKATFEIDVDYGRRLEHNRKREDLQRLEELEKRGLIEDSEEEEEESDSDDDDGGDAILDSKFVDVLIKVKNKDPSILNKDVNFYESDDEKDENVKEKKKKEKKEKKMYLKDIQAKQLLEDGPDMAEEENEDKIQTPFEKQKASKKEVLDAFEAEGSESDEDDLLREKEKEEDDDDVSEEDEKLAEKLFGEDAELDEGNKFLKDYFAKQLWKEKDGKSEIEKAELDLLSEDEDALEDQEEYETNYRHEEKAGEIVMGQSRIVEGSVRKKDSSRKTQRKNKEERLKLAEMERKEELKRLKNVKKKEIKEKMKKVLSIAGFKEGEECPLDAKDLDDEFEPEEYDQMMKAVFDNKYYGAEDDGFNSDEDDDIEKPDFDKEDELLGLPKDWDVIKGGDGFKATREKVLKHKEKDAGGDNEEEKDEEEEEEEEVEEEEEEVEEEEERGEGKRKRKRKASLVQRANEALMDEFYKLDYEDTIGDLKTRFKYAKVQPNKYELDTAEILALEDTDLNQYVPLKKIAPYVEKDWEVNKHKVREQKLKIKELFHGNSSKQDEKRSKKRKKSDAEETKPVEKADEEGEAKLSKKAKRRRRQQEKKLPPNRMAAYGKAN